MNGNCVFTMQMSKDLKDSLEDRANELETSIAALLRLYAVRGLEAEQ